MASPTTRLIHHFTMIAGGENVRPLSPCHLDVSSDSAAYTVRWIPRRRGLMGWSASGGDEIGAASFEVRVTRGSGVLIRAATAASVVVPVAEVDALGAGPIGFGVVELGAPPSRAALLTLNA